MTEEQKQLYNEALAASEDLRLKLAKIRIRVDGLKSPNIIKAIKELFGESYINDKGDSYITYDMYCSVVNMIRTLGGLVGEENL